MICLFHGFFIYAQEVSVSPEISFNGSSRKFSPQLQTQIKFPLAKIHAGISQRSIPFGFSDFTPDPAWSLGAELFIPSAISGLPFSADIFVGTVKYTGSISQARNPVIHSSSSLKRIAPVTQGTVPYLSSAPVSAPNISAAVTLSPDKNSFMNFMPSVQLSYSFSQNNFYASANKKIMLPGFDPKSRPYINFSLNTFSVSREKKVTPKDPWYIKKTAYSKDSFINFQPQISFCSKNFISNASICLQESPFRNPMLWFRTTGSLMTGPFCMNLSSYISSTNVITQSGTEEDILAQIQLNPSFTKKIGERILKTGISFQAEKKSTEGMYSRTYANSILRSDVYFGGKDNSIYLSFKGEKENLRNQSKIKIYTSARNSFQKFSSKTSAACEIYGEKISMSLSESIKFSESLLENISFAGQINFPHEAIQNFDSIKLSAGVKGRWEYKKISTIISISGEYTVRQ